MERPRTQAVDAANVIRRPALIGHHLAQLEQQALGHQARNDLLSLAGPLACIERGDDRHGHDRRRRHVVDGDRVEDRIALAALGRHHAAFRLHEGVEARQGRSRALVAIGIDRTGDDPRIDLAQGLVVDPEPGANAEAVVVDYHVGVANHLQEQLARAGLAEIKPQASDATIVGQESGAIAPERVSLGRLDLDDVRAQIGQQGSREGAGDYRAQIEHLDPR